MIVRPAGMSDDEEDDYDGFSFSHDDVERVSPPKNNLPNGDEITVTPNDSYKKGSELESHIMQACTKGQLDVIQEFVQKHNVNKVLHTGWTVLLYAAGSVQYEIIQWLLEHGANPNQHNDGFTPLMALCNSTLKSEDNLKCLILLLEAKADANRTTRRRETALMYACKLQDEEFVEELIKHVKDVNICDSDGKTALSYATTCNKPGIVEILLENNADVSLRDRSDLTPKDIADIKGFTEISTLLSTEQEQLLDFCQVAHTISWRDLFPDLYPKNEELLDPDIALILNGMGLERYGKLFKGMSLKTFLQLTETDLCSLGLDISVHRNQFLECLVRFHKHKWHVDSIHVVRKFDPFTIYNGVTLLGNMKKQISVMNSGFQYLKNNLVKAASENIYLTPEQRTNHEEELRKTQKTLQNLKKEMILIKELAYKIERESDLGVPASYISSLKKNKSNWIITLSVTLMAGLYLSRTTYIQRLWNIIYNINY